MKATRNTPEPKFEPVILTLETQAEVDAIYAVINHSSISDAIGLGDCEIGILKPFRSMRAAVLHGALNNLIK